MTGDDLLVVRVLMPAGEDDRLQLRDTIRRHDPQRAAALDRLDPVYGAGERTLTVGAHAWWRAVDRAYWSAVYARCTRPLG